MRHNLDEFLTVRLTSAAVKVKLPNLGIITPFPLVNCLATYDPSALQIDLNVYSSISPLYLVYAAYFISATLLALKFKMRNDTPPQAANTSMSVVIKF